MLCSLIDLQWALENDVIIPCFQPIVDLRTGRIAVFEVLARWLHPDHGPVLPENLISLAEQNGLIEELTRQILRKSFLAASVVPDPLFLAGNISPVQLSDLSLPGLVRETAREAGFPLRRVAIEITESALVAN